MRNLRSGDYREHRTAVSTLLGLISRAYPCFSIKLKLVISNCEMVFDSFGSNSACGAENRKSRCAVSKKRKKKTKYQDKPDKVPLVPQHSQAKGEETSPRQGLEQANIYSRKKNTKLILRMRNLRSGDYREHRTAVVDLIRSHQPCIPLFQYKT